MRKDDGHFTRSATSRTQRPSSRRPRESTTGPLPRHLISVLAFAELHRIPEQKVQAHVEISLLPVLRGAWTDHDGQLVTLAFDAKGRWAFHQIGDIQNPASFLSAPT